MTDLTEDHLNQLLERHPEGDIHETLVELAPLLKKFDSESDATRKEDLLNQIHSWAAVLEHDLREAGSGGEDFINDEEFLTR